ncbi:MAG: carbohydrate binding domain-containing protein, partial [Bacteroidaceae bacterium]|nr:carbohydrate binding domain-containing protein [Bacteroidaceae bacterium]
MKITFDGNITIFWLLFKNLTITSSSAPIPTEYSFIPYTGWVHKSENDTDRPNYLNYGTDETSRWQTHADDPRLEAGVKLQRTHEIEHVVWCMPGETCELTPYTDFTYTDRYRDNYIRWYNYPTGKEDDNLLSFPYPDNIIKVEGAGYFGGSTLSGQSQNSYPRKFGTSAIFHAPNTNDDILGTIAIEASTQFSYSNNKQINEPTLMFRTIFVIKNAKNRADAMAANNAQYINDNRVKLLAPANTAFQYHLPCGEDRKFSVASTSGGSSEPVDYYLRLNNKSSGQAWDAQIVYNFGSNLVPEGQYTLTFSAKANTNCSVQFGYQHDPHESGNGDQRWSDTYNLTTSWQTYTWNVTVDKNHTDINAIFLNFGNAVANIDIDNISLKQNGNNTNLINVSNGSSDFNNQSLGGWRLKGNNISNVSTSFISDTTPTGDPVHGYYMHLENTTEGGQKWDAQAMYRLSSGLVPNGQYTLTFFAKANESGKNIQFGYQNDESGHQKFSDEYGLASYWKKFEWTFTAGNDHGDVQNFFINFGKTVGQIDIDDIQLMYNGSNQISSNASNFSNNALNGWELKGSQKDNGKATIGVSNVYNEVIPDPQPTDYWYYDGTEYKPVVHYLIETWAADIDGNPTTKMGTTINIDGDIATMKANGSLAYTNKVMKGGYGDDYIDDIDRMIFIQNPQAGNYVIKIYALDLSTYSGSRTSIAGVQPIKINGTPLELMEYDLEIMPASEGNMITEEALNNGDTYKHQRPAEMEKLYGKPTTVVNFDEEVPYGTNNGGQYHKWPIQWEMSSYGFTYDKPTSEANTGVFDYNAYVVANDLKAVTYANASLREGNDIKNRYDRLYTESGQTKQGYMYYVNAASDPGRMALLDIGKDFCAGTRVYVSAWVMEANDNRETANVVFSFKGVAADGTETTLSSFVTGYINGGDNTNTGHYSDGHFEIESGPTDDRGKWMHVYYNFYPSVSASSRFDHFVISLENNATSSAGADYVIDDIRAFVCKPMLNALQENPVCNGDPATKLKLSTDFDRLLPAIGHKEATESATDKFYYCFIDSAAYVNTFERTIDSLVAKGKTETEAYSEAYPIAFNAAMVKNVYGYKEGSTTEFEEYGILKYDRCFTSNLAAPTTAAEEAAMPERTAYRESNLIQRLLNFPSNSNVNDTKIRFDRKYWVVMEGALVYKENSTTEYDIPKSFDLRDNCTSKNLFQVIFSGEIKVDGVLRSEQDGINICSNQRPVITIDLNGISGNAPVVTENAYFDWYFGPGFEPRAEFDEDYTQYLKMEEYEGVKLIEALEGYRLRYPQATATTKAEFMLLATDGATLSATSVYTDGMQACIAHYLDLGMIALYKQSGIVSSAKYSDILGQGEERRYYISAVPWNPTPEDKTVRYCLEPIQITLKADTRYPTMKDGNDDPNQVTYPTEIRDVPLRTGLRHLQAASHLTYVDPENVGAVIPTKPSWLLLPLRDVSPITQEIKILGLADDVLIYLADSNDPWVNALYENEKGKLVSKSGAKIVKVFDDEKHYQGDWSNTDVKFIGEVLEITAEKGKLGSYCKLAFYEDFKFREGYYYTIKFMFNEIYETGYTGAKDAVCPGEVICTIKVVPEYQKWTGAVDSNWNNDANWSRVSFEDLKYDPETMSEQEYGLLSELVTNAEIDDYVDTEGKKDTYANDNKRSYVPAEFTKVIIPADAPNMPIMYDLHNEANVVGNVKYAGSPVSCYSIKYMTPQEAIADGETTVIPFYDEYAERIDTATANINFDMASVVITKDNAQTVEDKKNINMVACVSWFDHTCEQIHFESRAEMLNQQFLKYEKASADFEIEPDRWYTMSSPLQNVVSGDMYLPTATARQETPYFKSIYYDVEKNDRFKPAVYQRKWNAQNATLFHLDKSRAANEQVYTTNAAEGISLDWSHVYNDTNEDFDSGAGFSIKADVSAIDSDPTKRPKQVMFRLPKADVAYTYFSPGNTDSTYRSQIEIPETMLGADGERTGRLVDSLSIMTGEGFKSAGNYANGTKSHYFLVGNPLMCTIDLAAFFDANPTLERKFWLLTKDGQRAAVMDEDGVIVSSTGEGFIYPYIKPFQSFFVVTKEDATTATDVSFTPKFTADMMHLSSSND